MRHGEANWGLSSMRRVEVQVGTEADLLDHALVPFLNPGVAFITPLMSAMNQTAFICVSDPRR
jgi:hypothetical protein